MLRLRTMEKALERAQEENLGAAFLDELLLGEADLRRASLLASRQAFRCYWR